MKQLRNSSSYLRDQGVRVTVNGDRLACSAPKGALTPELKAKLLQRKGELLEFLQPKILFDSLLPTAVTIADRRKLPLSFGQQRLWFLNQFQDDHSPYNIVIGMELDGLLDCPALEASFREIVARHEVLRYRMANVDGTPTACAGADIEWKLERHDFRSTEIPDRNQWTAEFARQQGQQAFDLGPRAAIPGLTAAI